MKKIKSLQSLVTGGTHTSPQCKLMTCRHLPFEEENAEAEGKLLENFL